MPRSRSSRPALDRRKPQDRRAPPGEPGSVRWWKGILGRPIAVALAGIKPRIVLVERRRVRSDERRPKLARLLEALRLQLVVHTHGDAASTMRQLIFVHDELARSGWRGVRDLSSEVLGPARAQAERLAEDAPSTLMDVIIERLQILQVGSVLREARLRGTTGEPSLEVKEATQEEFDAIAVSWADTQSPELPSARPKKASPARSGGAPARVRATT